MGKLLSSIVQGLELLSVTGSLDVDITGIEYDSRKIRSGNLFVAFSGLHTDGHNYIPSAASAGAAAVLCDRPIDKPLPGLSYVRVADARMAMSAVASAFYGRPSSSLSVIGVTGTEGKSTTVSLSYQLLNMMDVKYGFFSTVMSDTGDGEKPNPEHQTTPEATAVQGMLAAMRDAGCLGVVVEASSHGLSERTGRLSDVSFDVAVLTNVRSEHLEFHGTWERYRSDKANLFRNLDSHSHIKTLKTAARTLPSFGVVNADDPSADYFTACTGKPVFSYSIENRPATMRALDIVSDKSGESFVIEAPESFPQDFLPSLKNAAAAGVPGPSNSAPLSPSERLLRLPARINLPGAFNISNCLAALIAASGATGRPWRDFLPSLPELKPVRGRMTTIERGQPFEVLIDYAHTPSSFEAILPPIRRRVQGKVLCLFGSGGERDTVKRPKQGAVAAEYCDIVILTDEDPRGEKPMDLLEDIAAGCPHLPRGERLFLIPDRPAAIRKAFSMAGKGDIVLLLGKGHENSIIYSDGAIPYDEETEALSALAEMGFSRKNAR